MISLYHILSKIATTFYSEELLLTVSPYTR